MEGQQPVQVHLQLPAGTLAGLTRLVEQLRLLAAELGGGTGTPAALPVEAGHNSEFDPQRYEALRQGPDTADPGAAQADPSGLEEAQAVRTSAAAEPEAPAGTADAAGMPSAGTEKEEPAELEHPQEEPPAPPSAADAPAEEPASAWTEAEHPVEEPAAVRLEPESRIPEAEAAWARGGAREPTVQTARAGGFSGGAEPPSAGFVPASALEELSRRPRGPARELAEAGPAPLTAEAVSLAFRRDGRRYDNGFPLY